MAHVSNRNMTLAGKEFEKGQMITPSELAEIPEVRLRRMLRTHLILDVPDSEAGDICEICGEGPFTRIARHMTAKHDNSAEILKAIDEAQVMPFTDIPTVKDHITLGEEE